MSSFGDLPQNTTNSGQSDASPADDEIQSRDSVGKIINDLSGWVPNDRHPRPRPPATSPQEIVDNGLRLKIDRLQSFIEEINNRSSPISHFDVSKNYKIRYQDELNQMQLTAVSIINRPLLVIAGAGTGKTRTIVYKVAYLIENGVDPNSILLLTFTRKAAEEMLRRVQQLLGDQLKTKVIGGTFHSFANHSLRRYHELIGISPNFTIQDGVDSADALGLLRQELFAGKKFRRPFPKKATIRSIVSKSRNLEITIAEVVDKYFAGYRDFTKELEKISRAFVEYKKRNNIFDYDDLLEVLEDKLRHSEEFRQELQAKIKYVLVDEYQDVNNVQRRIVELIVGNRNTVTVVGDDAQSIYAFRGANYENILSFSASFGNYQCVKLERNYRSNQGVLSLVNAVIAHASLSFRKDLHTSIKSKTRPIVKRLADAQSEAGYIADQIIETMNNGDHLSYSNFSVLVRANWHSNFVQTEFLARHIPFVVRGGIKFVERSHIKDIMAFLKIVLNPLDSISWYRILNLLDGIGKVRASQVIVAIRDNGGQIDFSQLSESGWSGNLKTYESFYKGVDPTVIPTEAIDRIGDFYKDQLRKVHPEDYKVRLQDIKSLKVIAAKYQNLEKFLSDFVLEPPSNRYQDSILTPDAEDEDCVTISTIHSAKGLEWHTVFVIHMLDGLLPSSRSSGSIEELEEERRLFYVATSRAMDRLFITRPSYIESFTDYFGQPSRFIEEVNRRLYKLE